MLTSCESNSDSTAGSDTAGSDTTGSDTADGGTDGEMNPCNPDGLDQLSTPPEKPPIWAALTDLACTDDAVRVQAAADVTVGSVGELTATLQPIMVPFSEVDSMCPVNVHWHLGAEHKNTGTYDIPGEDWLQDNAPNHQADTHVDPGNFCHGFDAMDPMFTTPYEFEHCSEHMKVGYTYEIHWPHSNLGMCDTEWQYQSHFMNGVLCKANESGLSPADALDGVFKTQTTKIGVQAQVFTIVNDANYDYSDWEAIGGWNTDLAEDVAIYQGSTTGQQDGNNDCRGTGGMVTWQVDRGCHLISAAAFDELCKVMNEQRVDMSKDTHAHNARQTTAPAITTDQPM
ncbi:MAG: hypothetical protein ACI9WU_004807 [Myxococcota bacterium]|jgi:hypothetical protein